VREAIEVAGAEQRYLPVFAPDLNLIENAYAKIKSYLRKGAAPPNTMLLTIGLSIGCGFLSLCIPRRATRRRPWRTG
jgi:transposase